MMWDVDGWWGFGWWLHWLVPVVILGLLVWALVALSRSGAGRSQGGDRALDILRERYARGEISREEFDEKRRDLA